MAKHSHTRRGFLDAGPRAADEVDLAFLPVTALAAVIETRHVAFAELTNR